MNWKLSTSGEWFLYDENNEVQGKVKPSGLMFQGLFYNSQGRVESLPLKDYTLPNAQAAVTKKVKERGLR